MSTILSFDRCSDADLLLEIKRFARCEREATAAVIASLIELDARRLYLAEGCSSLFTYCTEVLHLSEHAAYGRIKAARTARAFPVVLELLIAGDITLTTVTLLAPHLTQENHVAVLAEARHKTKRHIEEIAARLNPQPAVPATVRKLPAPKAPILPALPADAAPLLTVPTAIVPPEPRPAVVMPLFDVDANTSIGDPTVARIRSKWTKTYVTPHPIELLAFYELQPLTPDARWKPQLESFVGGNWASGQFRRVWLFDVGAETIPYCAERPASR